MKIGIDIDGVLCNLNGYVQKYFKKYLEKNNIPYKFDKYKELFYQQFNVEQKYELDFWKEYIFHYAKHTVRLNNASLITNKLHNDGHKLIIITSRQYSSHDNEEGKAMREIVTKWLAKNKIYYDEIYYSNETVGKKALVINNKIDVMIDDSLRNINEISENIPVFVFKNSANRKAKGKNKIMVNGWKDIYKIITEMSRAQNKDKTLK